MSETTLGIGEVANLFGITTKTLRFYEKMGFSVWGTEPRGSRHQGAYIDETHMVRMLD